MTLDFRQLRFFSKFFIWSSWSVHSMGYSVAGDNSRDLYSSMDQPKRQQNSAPCKDLGNWHQLHQPFWPFFSLPVLQFICLCYVKSDRIMTCSSPIRTRIGRQPKQTSGGFSLEEEEDWDGGSVFVVMWTQSSKREWVKWKCFEYSGYVCLAWSATDRRRWWWSGFHTLLLL
jgi:hypothetical protein